MSDAASELAEHFHFLRLAKFGFEAGSLFFELGALQALPVVVVEQAGGLAGGFEGAQLVSGVAARAIGYR